MSGNSPRRFTPGCPTSAGKPNFPSGSGRTIDVDVSTILENLKMTFQGSFEVHKGHWGVFTDIVYLDVGDSQSQTHAITIGGVTLPGTVESAVDFDLKSTIWTLAGSYRGIASPSATVDWLAGARLANIDQTLEWEFTGNFGSVAPPPLTGSSNASVDQWDLIVGMKGRLAYGADHNWVVPFYFDVGAGDSDLTWQAMVGFGYAFGWGDLGVAWRYMQYDLGGGIDDMNFNGPAMGATFRW